MSWIKQAANAVLGHSSGPQVPDTVEEYKTTMPGSFPSSPPNSPANTKPKRPLSPASPDPQPKRQKAQNPAQASEPQPQPAQPKVYTERQQKRDFIVGGDVEFPEPASGGGPCGPLQAKQNNPEPEPQPAPALRIYHNGPEAQRMGGVFAPPPRPIVWPMAPKDMKIEDMPGFRGYVMRNGRRYPDFDEDTWEKGFSRTLRKHLSNRFKREV